MSARLCVRLGLVAGAAVGLLVGLLNGLVGGTPPLPPTVGDLVLMGLAGAFVAVLPAAAFAALVMRLPAGPVLLVATLVALAAGTLLGPLAYHLPGGALAMVVCGWLGGLLGWLLCRLVCGRGDARLPVGGTMARELRP
jgi:hypothetical protein